VQYAGRAPVYHRADDRGDGLPRVRATRASRGSLART
jgi:hypothetical protein